MTTLDELPRGLIDEVIATRRDLHAHPELGFEEVRTAGIVATRLRELGYEVHSGIGVTGVVGVLRSEGAGKTVMLRADMDALPLAEKPPTRTRRRKRGRCMPAATMGTSRCCSARRN